MYLRRQHLQSPQLMRKQRDFVKTDMRQKWKPKNRIDIKITSTIKNIEGKDYLQYEWIDLDIIDEISKLLGDDYEIYKLGDD